MRKGNCRHQAHACLPRFVQGTEEAQALGVGVLAISPLGAQTSGSQCYCVTRTARSGWILLQLQPSGDCIHRAWENLSITEHQRIAWVSPDSSGGNNGNRRPKPIFRYLIVCLADKTKTLKTLNKLLSLL